MRPIRLKMTAFGPYVKPVELDFEKGLGDEKFFLIHGATGSGKTTILDAICYALYGKSSGGGRTGEMMRSEQALPTEKTEVEFTFALRGKIYRIVRSPKYERAKLRGGGLTEEKASAELYENGKFIETKDVSEYMRWLLNFDVDQFRQVVMLPQGAFQKFLLAKSDVRQGVLNMLFNAEFFKRVEDELKLRALDAKKTFDTLTERKKNFLDDARQASGAEDFAESLLPTLIKNLADQLDAALLQLKTLETQVLDAQKKFSDGEKLSALFRDLEIKSQTLTNAQNLLEKISGELSTAKTEFDKRTAEEPRRKELERRTAELAKKKTSLEKLQSKQDALQSAIAAAKVSAKKVAELVELKKSCDELMLKLKSEVETLQDAPAKLKAAEQTLKDAQAREKLLAEIAELRKKISTAEKNSLAATNDHNAADKKLSELRQAQTDGSAARLAQTLEDGKPCPVCGAIHHPTPATSNAPIPTEAQIKSAESKLRALVDKKNSAAETLNSLLTELKLKEKNLSDVAQVVTVAQAQATFDKISADVKTLDSHRKRIKNGDKKIADTVKELETAQETDRQLSGDEKLLRGEVSAMIQDIDEKYRSNPKLLDNEISSATRQLNELTAAFNRAQENFNRLNNRLAAQRSTVAAAEKNKSDIAAQIEGKTLPDVPALKKIADDTRAAERALVASNAKLSARLDRLRDLAEKISALDGDLKLADKNFLMWKTLSDAASGKTSKISFQRYYLATMFKEVIIEANNRLEKMSGGRYRFRNKETVTDRRYSGGLDLEIVDDYTGTARPVETLSGGESFLASLSLALGLAAVVQNNSGGIKLDTIFIDEGFGTLDTETLDFAMKTLIDLQSGGRLVGIISHVEELKNQIPVRLEVTKTKNGSTAKFY